MSDRLTDISVALMPICHVKAGLILMLMMMVMVMGDDCDGDDGDDCDGDDGDDIILAALMPFCCDVKLGLIPCNNP